MEYNKFENSAIKVSHDGIPSSLRIYEQDLEKELIDYLIKSKSLGSQEAIYICMTIRSYVLEGFWAKVGAGFSGAYKFEYEQAIDSASRNIDPQFKKVFENLRSLIISALYDLEKKGFYDQLHQYCFATIQKNSSTNWGEILEDEFKELSNEMKKEFATPELVMSVFNESFKGRFRGMNDEQLIGTFNRELNNPEWTSSRELFQLALYDEFENRKYDYSAVVTEDGLSFKKKIKLDGRKIVIKKSTFLNRIHAILQ